jgi:hypothetical protein
MQQAVAAFFAAGAEVVAFHEQHLQQRLAVGVELVGVALHHQPGRGAQGAGRADAAVELDGAQAARPVRRELGVPAQVRDVAPRPRCGLQHGVTRVEGQVLAVQAEGLPGVGVEPHAWSSR